MDISFIASVILIAFVLFFESFILFFPILYLNKNKDVALALTIPLSISVQIITGYIFYCTNTFHIFPYVYFPSLLIINILCIAKISKNKPFHNWIYKLKNKINLKIVLIFLLLAFISIYSRFYDAISTVAPGSIDTLNHVSFLNDLTEYGFLRLHYYAPGFHIFLYPLTLLTSISYIYRFAGPVIGLITLLSIYFSLRPCIKNTSRIFLVLLLSFPVYNQLTLQTISFFSSALTFIFLTSFLFLLNKKDNLKEKTSLIVLILLSSALALTVPYFYVRFLPAILFLTTLAWVFKKQFNGLWIYFLKTFIIFVISGLLLAFGHLYIQTVMLHQVGKVLPKINQVKIENNSLVKSDNYNENSGTSLDVVKSTFLDIMSLKNIRPANNTLAIGAYAWIIISLFGIYFCIRKKDIFLLIIFSLSVIFGIATQTGILEMIYYRGRSGWHLMLLSIIGIVYIFNRLNIPYKKKIIFLFFILSFISTILFPPIFYRRYYKEIYDITEKIIKENPNKKIYILSDISSLNILSSNINALSLQASYLQKNHNADMQFIILEKKFLILDPILSQQALSIDKAFLDFRYNQQKKQNEFENTISNIKKEPYFSKYNKYWENKNIEVYEL